MKPTFFIDRDLGGKIFPSRLRAAGISVERHVDHFASAAPDADWLPVVASHGWYVLSNDKGILRKQVEREVVMNSGIGLFILVGGNATAEHLARNFINTITAVEAHIQQHQRPFIAKLYRPSPVSRILEGMPGRVVLKWPQAK